MLDRRAFSASVFLIHGPTNKVLLIKHQRLGLWLPPGGEREGDETPIENARRELKEETGQGDVIFPVVSTIQGVPPGLLAYEEHPAGKKGWHMNFSFMAITYDSTIVPDDSYDEWTWVPLPAIVKVEPTSDNVRQLVQMAESLRNSGMW